MSSRVSKNRRSKLATDVLLSNNFVWQGEPLKDERFREKKPSVIMKEVKTIYERTGKPRFRPPRSYR